MADTISTPQTCLSYHGKPPKLLRRGPEPSSHTRLRKTHNRSLARAADASMRRMRFAGNLGCGQETIIVPACDWSAGSVEHSTWSSSARGKVRGHVLGQLAAINS
jgi:hypothetical protein